jgi:hypothetical protein
MKEFKPVPGYEGLYEINIDGVVFSITRNVRCNKASTRTINGQMIKPMIHSSGYPMVTLWKCNKSKSLLVHRLIMMTFTDSDYTGMDVNHKNGIKTDNRIENLEWVTRKENIHHSIRMGLTKPQKRGTESAHAKLCTDGVRIMSYSEGAKAANYCISYFCGMLNGVYKNKTAFRKAG